MKISLLSTWKNDQAQQLSQALALISDVQTMQNFLRDVLSEKEIVEISARLETAKMLNQGKKYTEIAKQTNLSSRTIARISDWLQTGCGGYQAALKTINHHEHISPVRPE